MPAAAALTETQHLSPLRLFPSQKSKTPTSLETIPLTLLLVASQEFKHYAVCITDCSRQEQLILCPAYLVLPTLLFPLILPLLCCSQHARQLLQFGDSLTLLYPRRRMENSQDPQSDLQLQSLFAIYREHGHEIQVCHFPSPQVCGRDPSSLRRL
jgi:hypothetical protein